MYIFYTLKRKIFLSEDTIPEITGIRNFISTPVLKNGIHVLQSFSCLMKCLKHHCEYPYVLKLEQSKTINFNYSRRLSCFNEKSNKCSVLFEGK